MSLPTKESFLKDVSQHEITIISEHGLVRNIRFKRPGCSNMYFDITTWPGYLCISGDMHTFVFSRVTDMFDFFRSPELRINTGYWREKLQAPRYNDPSVRRFDADKARMVINEIWNDFVNESDMNQEQFEEIKEEYEDHFNCIEDEHEFVEAIRSFECDDGPRLPELCDFPWHSCESYSYHFVWCLYAICWAINKYDKHKSAQPKLDAD